MSLSKRLTGLFAGAALVAGALLGTAVPAQAYDPDPKVNIYYRDTDTCPCSGGSLGDPFDGTYFKYDAGGEAVKMELYDGSWFVGKVEFHAYDEKLWIYDTKNDGDTFYVHISYTYKGTYHGLGNYYAPGTSSVVDMEVRDLEIPEGAYVDIEIYDGKRYSDYIAGARGTGGAVA